MSANQFPEFFNQAPVIILRDPLAQFLGATPNGLMEYHYADAVKLCGHSCPTVAGAYLMVVKGLQALYGSDIPERGGVEVTMHGGRDEGTTGVTASVAQLLTGAAPETGFGGIGPRGQFSRRDLLAFSGDIQGTLRLRRRDNGQAVDISINGGLAPFAAEMKAIMPKAVSGIATSEELNRFGELWQARVKAFLVDFADNTDFVILKTV